MPSIDLSLYLVEKFCGHEVALQCAKSLLLSMPRSAPVRIFGVAAVAAAWRRKDPRDRGLSAEAFRPRRSRSTLLPSAPAWAPRNFIRRFKAATGRVPGAYIQMLRIVGRQGMLEQGATSIQAVCSEVGYEDIAFFRSLFKRHTGMTPADIAAASRR